MKYYTGDGLLNSAINKLPFEMHIPGYNWCGPGTKVKERLARNDSGVNFLDEACKEHDVIYSKESDLSRRHEADKTLARKALARFKAKDASWKEKAAALGVAGAMKAKVKLGMGLGVKNYKHVFRMCIRNLQKSKKELLTSLKFMEESLQILQIDKNVQKPKITSNKKIKEGNKKLKKTYKKRQQIKTNEKEQESIDNNMDVDIPDDYPMSRIQRKRKIDDDTEQIPNKKAIFEKPHPIKAKRKLFSNETNDNKRKKLDLNEPITLSTRYGRKRKLSNNDDNVDNENVPEKIQVINSE